MRTDATLKAAQARRIALAAQGFGPKRSDLPSAARIRAAIEKLGLLQIDSVNVLIRAHYLPLFSRLGSYDRSVLDRLASHDGIWPKPHRRQFFEYWGHEASLLPVACHPLLRWRMARADAGQGVWRGVKAVADSRPQLVAAIFDEIRDRGALGAGDLQAAEKSRGGWWGWSDSKTVLEWLFWTGRVTAVGRRGFERVYDLPERALPSAVLATPTPDPADAATILTRQAGQALGVATATDLRDYWRLPVELAAEAVRRLVEAGDLLPVAVEGWRAQAYLAKEARMARRVEARALLVPFDPLIFERSRTERLFGFRYRIEIYTPAEKRVHGYYVLPFLLGERLVARVDLKADRTAGVLLVRSAHAEEGVDEEVVAAALALELQDLAAWLGLRAVAVEGSVPFAARLARHAG
ncbi:MAG TPA: crosslink repair DNA glycosylase YcaQ family protein [Geminicoccus sp.]|jgi:hypothetical protein|uniref:winged helix-turn-helix domain-containing protein n=1 Tax=Geminicoccus sp. TaxID=2024832 RepID=UPI002E30053A|nr:crosslink repair DNA glycosylase YcaQ family protein [Geminicoccus sp.]HEX2526331.1 crosslink repair DNA glycosylase YcaQ family protein [Geminicoccus sp.]